ncbi:MAG TPA: glutamine-hydrolyzing carbamoyl-phosphate synthase small subunit [Myxococcota bacterium]|nr:glutamine-hydrolyzing carbamoyl-phosphate synthase small subunit [Myxococcota bacterium]
MKRSAHLGLKDGTVFVGEGLMETDEIVTGEIVFSTSMTGYTEILTDPSYAGQIVVMANPEIGNYGVNASDFQSQGIKPRALIVRNLSFCASSHRSQMTLADWLLREQIPVIFGLDTRALISHIRQAGSMTAAVSANPAKMPAEVIAAARLFPPMEGQRLSEDVGVSKAMRLFGNRRHGSFHVVVLDFGVKQGLLDCLSSRNIDITLLPGDTAPEEIWAHRPDGLFLSNGPGDPKTETRAVATVRATLGKIPIFGVCLGHQILAQALGYDTYKLKFGHRGSNQAVKCDDQSIITTAQNHGFAVSLSSSDEIADAFNISDGTNEGISLKDSYAFSVQFHPEGAPGPRDALFYFDRFIEMMTEWQEKSRLKNPPAAELLRV